MNSQAQSHLFWGINSPLTTLTGSGLLIIASGRISFALVCGMALIWVYVFSLCAAKLGKLPPPGRAPALLFLSALGACIFFVVLWILNPILALESSFFIFLSPVVFTASRLCERVWDFDMAEGLSQAVTEALILGILILGLSLIREPLGFGSVSVPGLDSIRFIQEEPLRILQASSGALIILGYGIAVYRYFRNRYTNSEDD
ncbi:MAG: hypothetical protein LBE02_01625 [Spirochaetaceae bacterium]|jgi:hypothetical protein|nr:hypothetical protein [Spirochaetaceae bacterium]